jgi:hypothetical protein
VASLDTEIGREVPPKYALVPGLALELAATGVLLDELQMAIGDIKLAGAQADWPLLVSSVSRLAALSRHAERTVLRCRKLAQKEGSHV